MEQNANEPLEQKTAMQNPIEINSSNQDMNISKFQTDLLNTVQKRMAEKLTYRKTPKKSLRLKRTNAEYLTENDAIRRQAEKESRREQVKNKKEIAIQKKRLTNQKKIDKQNKKVNTYQH